MPTIVESHDKIPIAVYFGMISGHPNDLFDPIFKVTSRCGALNSLIHRLNSKNSHRRVEEFDFMTRTFFRGLVLALVRDVDEPFNQLLAADLLHVICRNIYRALSSIGSSGSVFFAFENAVKEVAFPLLVVVSSPNLDGLTCSASWALVNLLKSTNVLILSCNLPTSLDWIHRLMLAEYVVEAFDVQLRSLNRLTHLLKRSAYKIDLKVLEDIDFDTLLPLFAILSHGSAVNNLNSSYRSRLQKHFDYFSKFVHFLFANISSRCSPSPDFIAIVVLPVFYECIQALINHPYIATTELVLNLSQFLLLLANSEVPTEESMAVIACCTSIIKALSTLSGPLISRQSFDFQMMCVNSVINGVATLRKCFDWSTYGGSVLTDLQAFVSPLTCEVPSGYFESILDSITKVYGETAIAACKLVGVLPWRSSMASLMLPTLQWMEGLVKLYVLPEGVEIIRIAGFQHRLAGAILSACDLLGRCNQDAVKFSKERFERLRLLYSESLS